MLRSLYVEDAEFEGGGCWIFWIACIEKKTLENIWIMKLDGGGGEWEAQFIVIYLIYTIVSVTTIPSTLCQQDNSVVWEKYCNNP